MKLFENKIFQLIVVIILSWSAIKPLFASGFFPMHDDTQVARVFEMGKSLKEGQFPVRIVDGLGYGYGYPIFNFYAPLPYYFGGLINMFGVDALMATKVMIGFGALLAGISMYMLATVFFGMGGGLLAALLYLYAPYHAVQIFVRGSVGELWAYGILPLVVFGGYKITQTSSKRWIVFTTVSLASIILSHNIIGALTCIGMVTLLHCYIAYGLLHKSKHIVTTYYLLLTTFFLSLGLSAFFWLPALVELPLTKAVRLATEVNFRDHFVYIDQLWSSPWGFAGSAQGRLDGMSFMLGKLHIILGIIGTLGCLSYLSNLNKEKGKLLIIITMLIIALASIFMMLPVSQPVWELLPPLHFMQFPWRLLVFAVFGLSLLAGGIGFIGHPRYLGILGVGMIVILFNTKYFKPQEILQVSTHDYTNDEKITGETSKIADEYLPRNFVVSQDKQAVRLNMITFDGGIITEYITKANEVHFVVEATQSGIVVVRKAYFPGWQVWESGKKIAPVLIDGFIGIPVKQGITSFTVRFKNTAIRTIGNMVTVVSIALTGFLLYEKRKKFS